MSLFIDFLLVVGFVVTFLIIALLLSAKQKGLSQKLLISFFVIIFLLNLDYYAVLHKLKTLEQALFLIISSLDYIVGPLILFYVKSVFLKEIKLKSFLTHLIPFFVFEIVFTIPYFISILNKEYLFHYIEVTDNYIVRYYVGMIFMITYTIISFQRLSFYQSKAKDRCSNLDINDLLWIRRLIIGVFSVLILEIVQQSYLIILVENNSNAFFENGYITAFAVTILMIYLGYYGFRRSKVLIPLYLLDDKTENENSQEALNAAVNLKDEEISLLKNALSMAFNKDKLYLDESLTLSTLASYLSTSNKKISWYLNHHLHTNFYDYVNKYRIDEFINRIKSEEYQRYTLLAIAFDSGFRSKTSFNRIFKNEIGMSPTEFKKQL